MTRDNDTEIVYGNFRKWREVTVERRISDVGDQFLRLIILEDLLLRRFVQVAFLSRAYRVKGAESHLQDNILYDYSRGTDFLEIVHLFLRREGEADPIEEIQATSQDDVNFIVHLCSAELLSFKTIAEIIQDVAFRQSSGKSVKKLREALETLKTHRLSSGEDVADIESSLEEIRRDTEDPRLAAEQIFLIDEHAPEDFCSEVIEFLSEQGIADKVKICKPLEFLQTIMQTDPELRHFLKKWDGLREKAINAFANLPRLKEMLCYSRHQRELREGEDSLRQAERYFQDRKYAECASKFRPAVELLFSIMFPEEPGSKRSFNERLKARWTEVQERYGNNVPFDFQYVWKTGSPSLHPSPHKGSAEFMQALRRASLLYDLFKWHATGIYGIAEL